MPLRSGCWASAALSALKASSPFQSVGAAMTLMPGNLLFMHSPNASERSRPLTDFRSPSNSIRVPFPPSFWPRKSQAFCPYDHIHLALVRPGVDGHHGDVLAG